MEPSGRSNRFRGGRIPFLPVLPALAVLLILAGPAGADIYRWVDDQGTVHFTDELSNVPPAARKSATLHLREAPDAGGSLSILGSPPSLSPSGSGPGEASASPEPAAPATREEFLSRIEQLKAKIDAKERHIRAVDQKRSLAVNPLRNRFVEKSDLDLYRKYQEELPEDREELRALEDALSSLK